MKLDRGENGYIDQSKMHDLKVTIILFLSIVVIYIVGKVLAPNYFIYFAVAAALLILPSAQFLSKYIFLKKYHSASAETFKQLQNLSSNLVILSDLILVRGKKTIFCDLVVLSDKQIVANCPTQSNQDAKDLLTSIFQAKGYEMTVDITYNDEALIQFTKEKVLTAANTVDAETQQQMATIIIENSI